MEKNRKSEIDWITFDELFEFGGDEGSDIDRVLNAESVIVFERFVFQVFQRAREDELRSHGKRERWKKGVFL